MPANGDEADAVAAAAAATQVAHGELGAREAVRLHVGREHAARGVERDRSGRCPRAAPAPSGSPTSGRPARRRAAAPRRPAARRAARRRRGSTSGATAGSSAAATNAASARCRRRARPHEEARRAPAPAPSAARLERITPLRSWQHPQHGLAEPDLEQQERRAPATAARGRARGSRGTAAPRTASSRLRSISS